MAFKPNIRIRIVDFYTKARERTVGKLALDPDGKPIYDDWVAYSPVGSKEEVRAPISMLSRTTDQFPDNPAFAIAHARWEYIRPSYEAWKKGEEAPEVGTPLSACNFLRKEDLQALKRNGVRSIEEFITLPEGARDRIQIPRVKDLQKQAVAFLDAQDANKAMVELEKRDKIIADLEKRLAALEAIPPEQIPVLELPSKRVGK